MKCLASCQTNSICQRFVIVRGACSATCGALAGEPVPPLPARRRLLAAPYSATGRPEALALARRHVRDHPARVREGRRPRRGAEEQDQACLPASYPQAAMLVAMMGAITTRGPRPPRHAPHEPPIDQLPTRSKVTEPTAVDTADCSRLPGARIPAPPRPARRTAQICVRCRRSGGRAVSPIFLLRMIGRPCLQTLPSVGGCRGGGGSSRWSCWVILISEHYAVQCRS